MGYWLVWSGGDGTHTGDGVTDNTAFSSQPSLGDWSEAYTAFADALAQWSNGDEIWVHAGVTTPHSETIAGNGQTIWDAGGTEDNLTPVIAVDKDNGNALITDPETPGAALFVGTGTTFFRPREIFFSGVWISVQDDYDLLGENEYMVNCKLQVSNGGGRNANITANGNTRFVMEGGILELLENKDGRIEGVQGVMEFKNVKWVVTTSGRIFDGSTTAVVLLRGCDLTGIAASADFLRDANTILTVEGCLLNAGQDLITTAGTVGRVRIHNSDEAGGDLFRTEIHSRWHYARTETGVVRNWLDKTDGGAGTAVSHAMANTGVNMSPWGLEGIDLTAYVDSTGSKTFTVELLAGDGAAGTSLKLEKTVTINQAGYYQITPYLRASTISGTMTTEDVWLEISYLGTSGSPKLEWETLHVFRAGEGVSIAAGSGGWSGTTTNNVLYVDPEVTVA